MAEGRPVTAGRTGRPNQPFRHDGGESEPVPLHRALTVTLLVYTSRSWDDIRRDPVRSRTHVPHHVEALVRTVREDTLRHGPKARDALPALDHAPVPAPAGQSRWGVAFLDEAVVEHLPRAPTGASPRTLGEAPHDRRLPAPEFPERWSAPYWRGPVRSTVALRCSLIAGRRAVPGRHRSRAEPAHRDHRNQRRPPRPVPDGPHEPPRRPPDLVRYDTAVAPYREAFDDVPTELSLLPRAPLPRPYEVPRPSRVP